MFFDFNSPILPVGHPPHILRKTVRHRGYEASCVSGGQITQGALDQLMQLDALLIPVIHHEGGSKRILQDNTGDPI